jgi:hypothetical protein
LNEDNIKNKKELTEIIWFGGVDSINRVEDRDMYRVLDIQ